MDQVLTVDNSGRVVLPSAVRRALHLKAGTRLRLAVMGQRIELTPDSDDGSDLLVVTGKRTVLRPTGRPSDAAAMVRAECDAQAKRAARRPGIARKRVAE